MKKRNCFEAAINVLMNDVANLDVNPFFDEPMNSQYVAELRYAIALLKTCGNADVSIGENIHGSEYAHISHESQWRLTKLILRARRVSEKRK